MKTTTAPFSDRLALALRGEESSVEVYWDEQDKNNAGPAYRDEETGESGSLEFTGDWLSLDGHEGETGGYYLTAYFKQNGKYQGPDMYGVYPSLEA